MMKLQRYASNLSLEDLIKMKRMNKPEIKMTRSGLYLLKNSSKTTLLLLLGFCVGPRTVLICDREIPFTSTGHLYIYTRKKDS